MERCGWTRRVSHPHQPEPTPNLGHRSTHTHTHTHTHTLTHPHTHTHTPIHTHTHTPPHHNHTHHHTHTHTQHHARNPYGPICSMTSLLIPFISFWRDGGFNLWLSFGEQENQIEFADVAPHTDRRVVNGDSMFYAILRSINQHSSTNR